MNIGVDVCVATYNSRRTIQKCLIAIREHVPYRRLIVVDHNSVDGTREITDLFKAEYHVENSGLGRARQLQIDLAETEVFLIIDSDVVVKPTVEKWLWEATRNFKLYNDLGAYVGTDPEQPEQHPVDGFWRRIFPFLGSRSFTLHLTLLRKTALNNIQIPAHLQLGEDYYIMQHLKRHGYTIKACPAPFKHIGQYKSAKTSEWVGANFRCACQSVSEALKLLVWKGLLHPLKLLPFLFCTHNWGCAWSSFHHYVHWVYGFLKWNKYWRITRELD